MEIPLPLKREHIFGVAIFLLAAVCGVLAFLQYRWIGEVATAEQQRLQQELQRNVNLVRRDFNSQITAACSALVPSSKEFEQLDAKKAYAQRYQKADDATRRFFLRIALAVPDNNELTFLLLDQAAGEFRIADWPAEWANLHNGLKARLTGAPSDPRQYRPEGVIEYPRFGMKMLRETRPRKRGAEQEWLILELDREYLRTAILPALLQRYLAADGEPQYSVLITESRNREQKVLEWGPPSITERNRADASTTLLELRADLNRGFSDGTGGPPPPGRRPTPKSDMTRPNGPPPGMPPPDGAPGPPGAGEWALRANHAAGSLETIAARARRRNLFLAAGLLSLLIATMVALIRFTRGAEKLAAMRINFVAGVSHELRTPLSALRAAGYSLRSKFSHQPEQVERYGKLIEDESMKLTALVEQILRYGSAESGRVLGMRGTVEIKSLIGECLSAERPAIAEAGVTLEESFADDLPTVHADRESLQHAVKNLLENAVKHGSKDGARVAISAVRSTLAGLPVVCVRIRDNGPGIPKEERELIFQPFFRGRRATEEQVRGTGLGLHLAKRIIEAHGGTLTLRTGPGQGTEFLVTIPATSGTPNESTDTFDRR